MSGDGIRASNRPPGALAKRWLEVLSGTEERLQGRIRRGKTLARSGRVQSLDIAPGTVYADVDDNGELHRPMLRVRAYEEEEWHRVLQLLGSRLELLAALMEGDVDDAFLETLQAGGITLFPSREELDGDCDCGDYAVPCTHGAAVHFLLAEAIDGDPMLLLALRGRPREQLIAELRRGWGDMSVAPSQSHMATEEAPPSGEWFEMPQPLPAMSFRFQPSVLGPGMLELGPLPGDGDLLKTFAPLYEAGADAARELALTELPESERRRRPRHAATRVLPEGREQVIRIHSASAGAAADQDAAADQETAGVDAAGVDAAGVDAVDVDAVGVEAPEPAVPAPAAEPPDDDLVADTDLGEQLVDMLAEADRGVSTRQLADQLGIASIKVRRELLELEALGVVARTGSTRATRWWLG